MIAPATVAPIIDGVAAVGVAVKYAREDHVHPTDTSRAPTVSPALTGNPTAPTPTAGDNDTTIATTAFVMNAAALSVTPGGRLSFSATLPFMSATLSAQNTIRYIPYNHGVVPIFDGTAWALADCSAGLSQGTTDLSKSPAPVAPNSIYDLFVWNDAGTVRCTRGPAWTNVTTRLLGISRQNGILVNTSAITNGPLAFRGTWVGTFASNAASLGDWIYGTRAAAGGGQATFNLWNAYNRCDVKTIVSDSTTSWTYALSTWRIANGAAGNRVLCVVGAPDDGIECDYAVATLSGAGTLPLLPYASIGIDVTNAPSGVVGIGPGDNTGSVQSNGNAVGRYCGHLAAGTHNINAIESAQQTNTVTFYGAGASQITMGLSCKLKM